MRAFHADPKIKAKYLKRVKRHQLADEIVKGQYWDKGKGCAVGCTIHSGNHAAYETDLGIPEILARLEDGIFENLPNELAQTWPRRFLAAIKTGADLSMVWPEFAVWMLTDAQYGVLQFARMEQQQDAINSVADLYQLQLEGAVVDAQDFLDARGAALAAYAPAAPAGTTAADAAAYAALAAYAAPAYAPATTAALAADAYAAYAAYAAPAHAKRTEWRIAQSEKLIELLLAAK